VTDVVEESQIDATWIHQEHDKVSSRTTVGGEAGVGAKRAKPMKRVDIGGKDMLFGGIAAMTKGRRTATCRAHTFVTCAVLNYDGLEHVMLNHPSFKSAVADWVKGRKVMFDVKEKSPKSGDARASESDPRTAGDPFERHPQLVLEGGTESEKIISAIQQLHLRMNALDSKVSDKIDDLPSI
jgi:hypothetical protein